MNKYILGLMFLAAFVVVGQAQISDIRQVDFKNFTYEPFCAGEKPIKVTVKDGEYSEEKKVDDYIDRFYFAAGVDAYGDVDGDGKDEAVVSSNCNSGGTGQFSEGFVYTLKSGKPVLIGRIEGGDRAYGGIREITIAEGIVTVDRNDPGEFGAACCAEAAIKTNYKWNGKTLVESGKPETRELYPAIRVKFDKGKSSGTLTATIKGGEFQRFVVGANKGQTMIVKVTPAAGVGLRFGEAETTENPGFLRAVLSAKGDYTFEVSNDGETEIEYTVTVEIK